MNHPTLAANLTDLLRGVDPGQVSAPRVSRGRVVAATVAGVRLVEAGVWGWVPQDHPNPIPPDEEVAAWQDGLWRVVDSCGVPAADSPAGIAQAVLRSVVQDAGAVWDLDAPGELHDLRALRAAYRGGYVAIPRFQHDGPVLHVDRNSSYPAQIRQGVPAGFVPVGPGSEILPDGIYRAVVRIPDSLWIPPLTIQLPSGATGAPTGRIPGVWVGCELLFAIELGCVVERIFGGWIPTQTLDFQGFIDRLYQVRKNQRYGRWAKTALNSTAGILGKREFSTIYRIGEIPPGWRAADVDDLEVAYREIWAPSRYAQPGGAAWVTASARVELLRLAYSCGPESVLYMDTDGLVLADSPEVRAAIESKIGAGIGQWKLVRQADSYACRALRQIRFGAAAGGFVSPNKYPSGSLLCGRISVGSGTVPGSLEDLIRADAACGYMPRGRIHPGDSGRPPVELDMED